MMVTPSQSHTRLPSLPATENKRRAFVRRRTFGTMDFEMVSARFEMTREASIVLVTQAAKFVDTSSMHLINFCLACVNLGIMSEFETSESMALADSKTTKQ